MSIEERRVKLMNPIKLAENLFQYLLIIIVILDCNTPYSVALSHNYHFAALIIFFTVCLLIIKLYEGNLTRDSFKNWLTFSALYYILMGLLLYKSVPADQVVNFIEHFALEIPLLALVFIQYFSEEKPFTLLMSYVNVVVIIALISIIFWLLGSMLKVISSSGTVAANWGAPMAFTSYHGLYFEAQTVDVFGKTIFRNIGIFTEAPQFSLQLVIALSFLELLNQTPSSKHKYYLNNARRIVLVTTIVTTFSTTAYILGIVLFSGKFILRQSSGNIFRLIRISLIIPGIAVVGFIVWSIFESKQGSASWIVRTDDYRAGFEAWKVSPIWGSGYGNQNIIQLFMNGLYRTNRGYSNSMFTILAEGGISLFTIYVLPIVLVAKQAIGTRSVNRMLLIGLITAEFIVTYFQYTMLMMVLLALLYSLVLNSPSDKYFVDKE